MRHVSRVRRASFKETARPGDVCLSCNPYTSPGIASDNRTADCTIRMCNNTTWGGGGGGEGVCDTDSTICMCNMRGFMEY